METIKRLGLVLIAASVIILGLYAEHNYNPAENYVESAEMITRVNTRRFEQTPLLCRPTPEEAAKYPQLTNLPTLYIELDIIRWDE